MGLILFSPLGHARAQTMDFHWSFRANLMGVYVTVIFFCRLEVAFQMLILAVTLVLDFAEPKISNLSQQSTVCCSWMVAMLITYTFSKASNNGSLSRIVIGCINCTQTQKTPSANEDSLTWLKIKSCARKQSILNNTLQWEGERFY